MSESTVGPLVSEEELKALNRENFFFKVTVELGPAFCESISKRDISKQQLLDLLEKHGESWKGFVGPMLKHFAEHYRINIQSKSDADSMAKTTLTSVYYGCGSCIADGVQGSLCYWDDGSVHCDKVC